MFPKLIDLKKAKKKKVTPCNEKRDQIEMPLVSVRTSSARYVKSTGDRARIILTHLFLVNTLENTDQFCSHVRTARLTAFGSTTPRGVSPLTQAASQAQLRTHTPGVFLISGNMGLFSSWFWALILPSDRQNPLLTNGKSGSSQVLKLSSCQCVYRMGTHIWV